VLGLDPSTSTGRRAWVLGSSLVEPEEDGKRSVT